MATTITAVAATATAVTSATAATTATAVAATTAAATSTAAVTAASTAMAAATAAAIFRIRAGPAERVRHQYRRCRQYRADGQRQQTLLEHDEPPLGVARAAQRTRDVRPPHGATCQPARPSITGERDPSWPAGRIFLNIS
ncbi:hypothetical protein [Pseudomonas sp. KU43P]|uniref:hypothetical protein n=1 Tax=Pseudomonas sp. KU43P TaxID=2487887 RepID=UPI0029546F76|nr:hypothetical protein [Pseudomonas sp. KU43P]